MRRLPFVRPRHPRLTPKACGRPCFWLAQKGRAIPIRRVEYCFSTVGGAWVVLFYPCAPKTGPLVLAGLTEGELNRLLARLKAAGRAEYPPEWRHLP